MPEGSDLGVESAAVRTHVEVMQGVIERMATNSRSCKVWCITLVAAVLVLVARTGEAQHAFIAIVPTALFLALDMYYLALERAFVASYDNFVGKVHEYRLTILDVYTISPTGSVPQLFPCCLLSFSIWPFYALMIATIVLAWRVIL